MLSNLGDVRTLTVLGERFPGGHRGRQLREAAAAATAMARQVELDTQARDTPLRRASQPDLRELPDSLDPELFSRVLHTIERVLSTNLPANPEYAWALRALTVAPLAHWEVSALVQSLVQARRDTLDAAELGFVEWFLKVKTTWELPEVTPEFAVELWQFPPLRLPLAKALANGSGWPRRYHRMTQAAQRTGQVLDGLLELWLPLHLDRDVDTAVSAITTRADLHRLLDVALSHRQPAQWLAIYRALGGYAEAACFLARLPSAHPDPEALAQLQRLVEGTRWHHPDEEARGGWLRARLADLRGPPTG